jgi:hypothetical protein
MRLATPGEAGPDRVGGLRLEPGDALVEVGGAGLDDASV